MPGKSWRVSELRQLTDAVRDAQSPSEISIAGRSAGAVRAMASRLRLIGDGISRKRWPASDVTRLRDLIAEGQTAKSIAESNLLPGYGRNAIQKQMQRLGLGRPERSLPQKQARRLAGDSVEAFTKFLQTHAPTHTPAQLTALWNANHQPSVSHQRVLYHLGRLGLRNNRSENPGSKSPAQETTQPETTDKSSASSVARQARTDSSSEAVRKAAALASTYEVSLPPGSSL